MNTDASFTQPALMRAVSETELDAAAFFGSLSPDEFVLRVGSAWTPAEHLDHLNIVASAVARGFSLSRLLLRLRFGRAHRPSRSFEELRDDYRARLAAGGGATGRFVPDQEIPAVDQGSIRQQHLLARWQRVNERLRIALEAWSERDLDRIQLPHPILGKITAREMMFFTIYHGPHHVAAAKGRLPRFTSSSAGPDSPTRDDQQRGSSPVPGPDRVR